jgi:cyanophycin synthetase
LRAIIAALDVFPHRGRSALYTMAGDRRDADIVQIGEMLGDAFDSVIMYEPYSVRGRAPGEIASLIREGLKRGARVRHVAEIPNPIEAAKYVLDRLGPGDLLVLQPDDIDESVRFVRDYLGHPDRPESSPEEFAAATARAQ